ncbi:MAG: response regulator, partial [Candidatus Aminicenantes bacterium]|nr:response regulator [Candidatus Aminicenantes bacterium]
IKNYSPKEYNNSAQNWSIIQDNRGIIYIGNQGGLLEFDGVSWRSIAVPNSLVRSLAIDNNGIVYIGGKNEIGFLTTDLKGALLYESLRGQLDNNLRNFSMVWQTHSTEEGIYFHTSKFLFRWNSKEMKVWQPQKNLIFNASFNCGGELYIRQQKVGLMKMVNDSLVLVPKGEIFAEKRIYLMTRYNPGNLLIGTRGNGFYLYNGADVVSIHTEADDYIKKNYLLHGIRVYSGDFALATIRGGLVIMDSRGELNQVYNKDNGLLDNDIKYVFEDTWGNLWLAMNKGISKIEFSSPISTCDDRLNLPGMVLSITRHGTKKNLYAGTSAGLFSLTPIGEFRPVPGISSMCYSLLSTGDSLFAATESGVFLIGSSNSIKGEFLKRKYSFVLHRSKMNTNRIWVGTGEGLFSLYLEKNRWRLERKFENITEEIRSILEEDKTGYLWLGLSQTGVIKADFRNNRTTIEPEITVYESSFDLTLKEVKIFFTAGHVSFATNQGIYRFNDLKNVFIPDFTLGKEFAGGAMSKGVFRLAEDEGKNIWFHSGFRNVQAVQKQDGTFGLKKKPFLRIPPVPAYVIYPDIDDEAVWFGGDEGIIRYDKRVKKDYDICYNALLRKVVVNGKTIYNGCKYPQKPGSQSIPEYQFPKIDYKDRNLRFEFAAPFFEGESSTEYQCLLLGYNKNWLTWTSEAHKEYTNLDSGTYTFRVRAKNVYNTVSEEDVFHFKVLPPWTKTWWALLFYVLVLFLLVFFIVRWQSGRLEREKRKLEKVVEERTKEINHKSRQLERQTFQLQEQSEKLKEMDKVKSHFFANISHEFRTPLTLIMGPLEQMLSVVRDKEKKKSLNVMLWNSQRLLTLINQLLDLSRFDSGKMKLRASRRNIIPFLKDILDVFEPLAVQNKVDLIFSGEAEDITLFFDTEKLEEIITNLLSNALKFTPAGGKIFLSVKTGPAREETSPPVPNFLEISVRDTGIGIPKDQLEYIFDRFYQADKTGGDSRRYYQKSTGIGLALTKELVGLHHGRIDVHSSEGKGTEFIIRLPMGTEHLKPEEIVETTGLPFLRKNSIDISHRCPEEKEGEDETIDVDDKDTEPVKDDKNVILVVEDNAEVRRFIRGPLKPLYHVKEAVNGRKGIVLAKKIIPDLIISDIMMPEVDGYELCNVLKKDIKTSHIPIILLTAKASEESIIRGLETGADDYITKPFNTRILLTRVRNLIDLRLQLQQKIQREMMLQPAEISVSSIDQKFIKELQEAIEKNLGDALFGVEQLGKKLYMSRTSLYRKIFGLTGESPREFIKSYRLKRGAQLLKANFGNVTEVAFETGFSSTSYFIKCFKEKFHQSPHTFQASESAGV